MHPRFTVSTRRGSFKAGCLISLAVVLVIALALGIWVAVSWKGWFASAINNTTVKMVDQSQLPDEQKDRVKARVSQLTEDFKVGKISFEQLGKVTKNLAEGPLFPLISVWTFEEHYLAKSTLPDDEKAAGSRTLQRYARGVTEKKISANDVQTAVDSISEVNTSGQRQVKQTLTNQELQTFLASLKAKADAVNVPDEPFTVNVADEIDKAIDEGLGKTSAGTPLMDPPPSHPAPTDPAPTQPAKPASNPG